MSSAEYQVLQMGVMVCRTESTRMIGYASAVRTAPGRRGESLYQAHTRLTYEEYKLGGGMYGA